MFMYVYVCMYVLHMVICMRVLHMMSGASGGQNWVLDPLELELKMVVSHNVSAGNRTQVLCESNTCSQPLCNLPNTKSISL